MSNKLIDRLEELADEMKVIVHQLRVPSTIKAVEDVIEFEGQQYKKVDREARVGDVVVFNHKGHEDSPVITGKPYPVNFTFENELAYHDGITESVCSFRIYDWGRTTKDVDVYELIEESKQKIQGITIEIEAPKSANQQRAEVIEKASSFVDENGGDDFHFEVDEKERQILAWKIVRKGHGNEAITGLATCHPNAVYNEHIGKAIALGRALGLDVSEFENAPQPNRRTNGMVIEWRGGTLVIASPHVAGKTCDFDSEFARYGTIINDTNAECEVNA